MSSLTTTLRTTASNLVLAAVAAAVVTLCSLVACRPQPATLPATTTNNGRFELAVRVDPDDSTRITVVVTSNNDAFETLDTESVEGLITLNIKTRPTSERRTPVVGSLRRVSNRELHFSPSFPLLPGSELLVTFQPQAAPTLHGQPLECQHLVPATTPAQAPSIVEIYPTADVVPANHLKFYIVFSEPMQPGEIWNHFRLLDLDSNRSVPRPFRHTQLWSRDNRTLTLWFHPGRVKQGVNLNTELGAILVEGRSYRLGVSGDWPSARGTPLGKDVSREFTAGAPDHSKPDPADWNIQIPASGSKHPLTCQLHSTHDWALLHSDVAVETANGQPLPGTVTTSKHQSNWHFTPKMPWKIGRYRLAVGSVLEDLAGNNLQRPFEVDLTQEPNDNSKQTPTADTVYREFSVVGPKAASETTTLRKSETR